MPRSQKVRQLSGIVVVLAILNGCASVGSGDPVVVRAEDVLVNSLSVYGQAMVYHQNHSTTETPQLYKALEAARIAFPPAWKALDAGITAYKADKDKAALQKLLDVVGAIVSSLQASGVVK